MTKEEKILLALAFVGLVFVLLFQRSPEIKAPTSAPYRDVDESSTNQNASMTTGPEYLMYNTPWAFAPPVMNTLPTVTAGQVGQTVEQPTDFSKRYSACGCKE